MRTVTLLHDANGREIFILPLSDPQDVDGTFASAVCANPINGKAVRIKSIDNALRFVIGPSSEENPLTVGEHGVEISAQTEIYQPCNPGEYVAVIGGKANISTVGL